MSFEWFVSWRYLKAKRRQGFISIITIISMAGVGVGVAAMVIVLSVMNGYQKDVRDKILGVTAHVVILSHEGKISDYPATVKEVEEIDGVVAATPFIYSQAMISADGRTSGTVLRGVDTESAARVTKIKTSLKSQDIARLKGRVQDPRPAHQGELLYPIVVGQELAASLGVSVGSVVQIISPFGRRTPMGRTAHSQSFAVTDLFRSGLYEYDATMSFLSLEAAQKFLGLGPAVTGIEIKTEDIYRADKVSGAVSERLKPPFWARDWMEMNYNLFSALKLEKTAMFIMLILIVLVAAFNIISALIMIVMEKAKDVAILKSFGATSAAIMRVFIFQGLIIGVVGTTFGLVLGLFLCELLRRYKFIQLPTDVYYISTLPVRVEALDVAVVCLVAVAISFLATIYPSRKAARVHPAEALRYE